jgi:glycyl-tRNA synthetase beta subunit
VHTDTRYEQCVECTRSDCHYILAVMHTGVTHCYMLHTTHMYMYNVHTHTNRSAQRRAVRRAEAACEEQQDEWDQELDEQQQLQQAEEAELLHNVGYTTLQLHLVYRCSCIVCSATAARALA